MPYGCPGTSEGYYVAVSIRMNAYCLCQMRNQAEIVVANHIEQKFHLVWGMLALRSTVDELALS